jgi:hypothetical protein
MDFSPPQRGLPWSLEEEDQLRALLLRKIDRRTISRQLGRTQGAIEARIGVLGLRDLRRKASAG